MMRLVSLSRFRVVFSSSPLSRRMGALVATSGREFRHPNKSPLISLTPSQLSSVSSPSKSPKQVVNNQASSNNRARAARPISSPKVPAFATASSKEIVRFINESVAAKSSVVLDHYEEIASAIEHQSDFADPSAIASVLFSMKQSGLNDRGVSDVLRALAPKVLATKKLFSALELSKCFSGLRNMGSNSADVRALLAALAFRVATCSDPLQSRAIGTILYSMHKMNSNSAEVLKVLQIVAEKIEELEEPLDGQCIGNSLYGLRYMSSKHDAVKAIVAAITFKIPELSGPMKAQEIANGIYGLQSMNCEARPVREAMGALAAQLQMYMDQIDPEDMDESMTEEDFMNRGYSKKYSLTAQEVATSLYGLQNMTSSYRDTRTLLAALTPAVKHATTKFTSQSVGTALYGLQSMTASYKEVKEIITALTAQIDMCQDPLNTQSISNALYGLKSMNAETAQVRGLLSVLARKISISNAALSSQAVGNCLYGLQSMGSEALEVRAMLSALVPKIKSCNEPLTAQAVGNALYGLKSMNSNAPEVREVLDALTQQVSRCTQPLSSQAVGNALYGLQSMDSSVPEVKQLLKALTPIISSCADSLNGQAISNSMYGLKSMSCSDGIEIRQLVKTLAELIRKSGQSGVPMMSKALGSALYGLKGMDSHYNEVIDLLEAITPSVTAITEPMDGQALGNALYGMQRMGTHSAAVRNILKALGAYIQGNAVGTMSSQEISNALYGLRSMESCDETSVFISTLAHKILDCTETFSSLGLAECFFGLQNMTPSENMNALLSALVTKIENCLDPIQPAHIAMMCYGLQSLNEKDAPVVRDILQRLLSHLQTSKLPLEALHCANIIYGLQNFPSSGLPLLQVVVLRCNAYLETRFGSNEDPVTYEESVQLVALIQSLRQASAKFKDAVPESDFVSLRALEDKIASIVPNFSFPTSPVTASEDQVHNALLEGLSNALGTRVQLTRNENLHHFESDIVLRMIGSPTIVNVEVDGIVHEHPTKRRFCQLRDDYLRSQNVHVIRVNTADRAKLAISMQSVIGDVNKLFK